MGRAYGAGDDPSMESFFSLLQKNVLDTRHWDTRDDLHHLARAYIDCGGRGIRTHENGLSRSNGFQDRTDRAR
jgi:hypothetical protein